LWVAIGQSRFGESAAKGNAEPLNTQISDSDYSYAVALGPTHCRCVVKA